jgi:hypothetical protein
MMANSPRMVRWSVRIYETLINAYPTAFRKKFGCEMLDIFRELVTDAWQRHGIVGLIMICLRVLVDLARTVPKEHLSVRKNDKGEIAMTFKSLFLRKIGPDRVNPRTAQIWFFVYSFFLLAMCIKALTNMKLTNFELLFGIALIAEIALQGIAYGLLHPLLKSTSSGFKYSSGQIVIYVSSFVIMIFGIRSLTWFVQTEFQLFSGVMLWFNIMLSGCFIAEILPLVRANREEKLEQEHVESTITSV